jgi:hypothetical protein
LCCQPKLLRRGNDPISLMPIIRKYLKTACKRLFSEFGLAKHDARPDQFDPSIRIVRRLLKAARKTVDHALNHDGPITGHHRLCRAHILWTRPSLEKVEPAGTVAAIT